MQKSARVAAVASAIAAPILALAAAGDPVGSEFQVSTFSSTLYPDVAMGSGGNFVVVWQGGGSTSPMQRFDASGVKQGSQSSFGIDPGTFDPKFAPRVASDASGNYAVTWSETDGIHARVFSAAGAAQADPFLVPASGTGEEFGSDIAMDADGDFVVVWPSAGAIKARRFDESGAPQGDDLAVAATGSTPRVAMDDAGNFIVVWSADGDGDQSGIHGRRYNAAGEAQGDAVVLNTTTAGSQSGQAVAMDTDGDFVVVWHNFGGVHVIAQRFNAAGAAQGGEITVGPVGTTNVGYPDVAMDDAGNFLVVWEQYVPPPAYYYVIYSQRFTADGTGGSEFQVNTSVSANLAQGQHNPAAALDADGDTIAVWYSDHAVNNNHIYGQRYAGANVADTTPNAFTFTDQPGVALSTVVTSDTITVGGITADAAISVTGPGAQYSINGGGFPSGAATVANGDTVQVRHTSSAGYATAIDTVVTIGGVSDTFTSTTLDAPVPDTTPDAFTLTDVTGAEPDTETESNVITVSGVNAATPIGISGGFYKIGTGEYTANEGTVGNGQTVQVMVASSVNFETEASALLTIGGVSDTFTVTTRAANSDTVADANNQTVGVSTSTGTLMNLQKVATPIYVSSGYQYANGFFAFDITGVTPGGTATVTMTLPSGAAPTLYVKCTGSACAVFSGASIAGNVVTLTLTDGGAGDADGAANGTISDPGAPATTTPAGGGGYSGGGGGYGGSMGWLTVALGLPLAAWRRRYGRVIRAGA